jgi:hypothetical protein
VPCSGRSKSDSLSSIALSSVSLILDGALAWGIGKAEMVMNEEPLVRGEEEPSGAGDGMNLNGTISPG